MKDFITHVVFPIIILLTIAIVFAQVGYDIGNKDGQIKALTGKSTYILVTKDDSTKVWEEIETK